MLQKISSWKNNQTILAIILVLLSSAVYLNTYQNQFAFDDDPVLLGDYRFKSFSSLVSIFTQDYWMIPDTNLYRPLPLLSFAVNYLLFGKSPWSYHVINQMLHSLNVILLFIFLGNFYKERLGFRFLAAAIFAVHPAATEAVNLIVGRADLLAFAFSLSAFHLYIQRDRGKYFLPGSVVLYFLGMLSKENAMILPLFLLLYHLYFERDSTISFIRNMIGYGVAFLLVSGIRYAVLGAFGPQATRQFFHGISWSSAASTMIKAIAYYWKIAFWPKDLQVNYDFNDFPVASSFLDAWVLFSLAFMISVIASAFWLFRKDRALSYFILWPFIAFLPVMNIIVPTGIMIAVRLMYLPLAGYSVVLAAFLYSLKSRMKDAWHADRNPVRQEIFFVLSGIFLLMLSAMTVSRNADWKDTETLFKKELLLSPRSVMAMRLLAPELPLEEREALLSKAVEISPFDPVSLSMLGEIYEKKGDHAGAETLQRRSLFIEPTARAHKQLGIVLSHTGRLDEAEEQFKKAIALRPFWVTAYEDLAIVYFKKGDRESALAMIQRALSFNSGSATAHNLIGTYYKETGEFDKSARAFQKAVELSSNTYFEAMYNLADAYEKIEPEMAVRAWKEYIKAAEEVDTEMAWVGKAKERVASLEQDGRHHE